MRDLLAVLIGLAWIPLTFGAVWLVGSTFASLAKKLIGRPNKKESPPWVP